MKNRRANIVVVTMAVALLAALVSVLNWYRSGAPPEPPASFFDTRDAQRAIARLESHRLDQSDRLQHCRAITNHIEQAKEVTFSNPARTQALLTTLQARLASLSIPSESAEDAWTQAFYRFAERTRAAYGEAQELTEILRRNDWSEHSVPLLERRVVRAKELCASLQAFPPWQSNAELRTQLYPTFEEAYRHRDERDAAVLTNLLLAPGPALTRWYHARLLEDRSGLPPSLCATAIEEQTLSLERIDQDLRRVDAQGILRDWQFPAVRAAHLATLAAIVRALEASTTLGDWLAAAQLQSPSIQDLIQQAHVSPEQHDVRVRVAADQLQALVQDVRRTTDTLETMPGLPSLGVFVQNLRDLRPPPGGPTACVFDPLEPGITLGQDILHAARDWANRERPEAGRLIELKRQTENFSQSMGIDVADQILADTFDQWCELHWPPHPELGAVAALIRSLHEESALHTPFLAGAAALLENMAATTTEEDRARLRPDWERRIRPRLLDYPMLVRLIDQSFGIPVRRTARDEQRALLNALQPDKHSFQRMRAIVDAQLRPPFGEAMSAFAQQLNASLERLQSIVEQDRRARTLGEVSEIATAYSTLSNDPTVPAPLSAYARAQARSLLSYTLPSDYTFTWMSEGRQTLSIAYDQLGADMDALGHGRRRKGRGENLQLWIRAGHPVIPILQGDWKDDPESGCILVSDLEPLPHRLTWQWGEPVEIGVRVAHTLNPDKNLVPDKDSPRSRWNPLNYGVYRVQTNDYVVAAFPTLEQMVRTQLVAAQGRPRIRLDRLLAPGSTETAPLRFEVDGIPPGRDFDWPVAVAAPSTEDLRQLRSDVESAVSNLVDGLLPP